MDHAKSFSALGGFSDGAESGEHLQCGSSSALFRLFSVGWWLLHEGSVTDRLLPCLVEAKAFLERTSIDDLFFQLFLETYNQEAIRPLISHIDHVGLVIPAEFQTDLPRIAAEAGFAEKQVLFPSQIVARELGALVGRESVPTMIFKACGRTDTGSRIRIETFLPSAVPTATVHDWIEDGVGSHVAFVLKRPNFEQVIEIFRSEGFEMPSFMNGEPMTNDAEGVTVAYFDGLWFGRRIRIECCHLSKLSMVPGKIISVSP